MISCIERPRNLKIDRKNLSDYALCTSRSFWLDVTCALQHELHFLIWNSFVHLKGYDIGVKPWVRNMFCMSFIRNLKFFLLSPSNRVIRAETRRGGIPHFRDVFVLHGVLAKLWNRVNVVAIDVAVSDSSNIGNTLWTQTNETMSTVPVKSVNLNVKMQFIKKNFWHRQSDQHFAFLKFACRFLYIIHLSHWTVPKRLSPTQYRFVSIAT